MWFLLFAATLATISVSYAQEETLWIRQGHICFGAKDDSFGKFTLTHNAPLVALKLVHRSGKVTCSTRVPTWASYWGCNRGDNLCQIGTVITDEKNQIIFPKSAREQPNFYRLPGYHLMSDSLAFTDFTTPMYGRRGQELRVWYLEDLNDSSESDNGGQTCADVYARFEESRWILQDFEVCFDAIGKNPGKFQLKQDGALVGLKLIYQSGYVSCDTRHPEFSSHWGCNGISWYNGKMVGTVVTDDRNQTVFPKSARYTSGFYQLPGYNATSDYLAFTDLTTPMHVRVGQELDIWYMEDLIDAGGHGDDGGTTCCDVYAKFA